MDCYGATEIGKVRSVNEDQFLVADISKSMRVHQTSLALDHHTRLFGETQAKLLLVCDGLGGHEAGERASQLVVDGIVDYVLNHLHWLLRDQDSTSENFEVELKEALCTCQETIYREMQAIPQRQGMGSTLTMAYICWPRMFLIHVGDSRCYLLRGGALRSLTRDHSLGDAADEKPGSHILWNVIGGGDGKMPRPDILALDLELGDTLLLCTDGLSSAVEAEMLRDILADRSRASVVCDKLIRAANDRGGDDNITSVVAKFVNAADQELLEAEEELPQESKLDDTVDFPADKNVVASEIILE